jgi:hypothetical protein
MKLTLDHNSAADPTQIELGGDATDRSKLRLRGSKFFYTPRPIVVAKVDLTEWSSVTLIYRGNTYERKLQPPQPYRQPRTLNWRWQTRRVSELESK